MEKAEKVHHSAFRFSPYKILEAKTILVTLAKGHSTFSQGLSSETTLPVSMKFHIQPSSKWGLLKF